MKKKLRPYRTTTRWSDTELMTLATIGANRGLDLSKTIRKLVVQSREFRRTRKQVT